MTPRETPARALPQPAGMTFIEGGTFTMGSERFYPVEWPLRRVRVDPFWIDATPVTNAEFAAFVAATGYRTTAESAPDPRDYSGIDPQLLQPASLVFDPPNGLSNPRDITSWWSFRPGAQWRHPEGLGSTIEDRGDHPVVHVSHSDAKAYASWAGKRLATEAEWELAARGGHDGWDFAWGDELAPAGQMLANFWQGQFPATNQALDGYERTSPVGSFPANDFGLVDMIGNVWEWTSDWFTSHKPLDKRKPGACCVLTNPRGGRKAESFDPMTPQVRIGRKVLKGGSFLCAENYCQRYRPAARQPQTIDTSPSHIGFRCAASGSPEGRSHG
jgi:formylglycine-generating enzyme required for sulfatase activity